MAESRRVKLTKKLIKDSLLELLEDNPISKITVKQICENADVNRTTFYVYYETIDRLLAEIENDVLSQIPVSKSCPTMDSGEELINKLTGFFDYVNNNRLLFDILLFRLDNNNFCEKLMIRVKEIYISNSMIKDTPEGEYIYIFCSSGVLGLMKKWMREGYKYSSAQMAEAAIRMCIQTSQFSNISLS